MKQAGYTLIELVVVISITIILLVSATSLFYTTFIGGNKTASAEQVKQSGQHAMNQIVYLIHNARKLVPNNEALTCDASMVSLGLLNQDLGTTILAKQTDTAGIVRIASNSGAYITPGNIVVSAGPTFSCSQISDGSPPTIIVTFSLRKGVVGIDRARDIIEIPFQSQVTMRNF